MTDFAPGISLYQSFLLAFDPTRQKRLADRLDTYYNGLSRAQQHDFTHLLVDKGLIRGDLAQAIKMFDGTLIKISY